MPDFSLLQTPNFLATATGAFQAGQQQAQQRNRQNALAQYGTDPTGARNALMGMGDVETAGQLQAYENNQAQAQFRGQQQERQQQVWQQQDQDRAQAAQDRTRSLLVNEARALRMTPQEQRADAYNTRAAPLLAELRFPPEVIAQALEGGLTDEELDGFIVQMGGEVAQPKYVNTDGGLVAISPYGGDPTIVPNTGDPDAALRTQLLQAQIASTRSLGTQREASAARARHPAAGAASVARRAPIADLGSGDEPDWGQLNAR